MAILTHNLHAMMFIHWPVDVYVCRDCSEHCQ